MGIASAIALVYISPHGTTLPKIVMVVFQALLMRQAQTYKDFMLCFNERICHVKEN